MYRTSALRDTDTLLDENDLKAKQDDVNTKRILEPMANALSSRGPREREIRQQQRFIEISALIFYVDTSCDAIISRD